MKYNRPGFVKKPTESIYDDKDLYSKRCRRKRIESGKSKPNKYIRLNTMAEKERLRMRLAQAGRAGV